MLNFLLDAAGNTADAAQQSPLAAFSMPIMLIAMIAIFYFLMIRPQRKQEKEAQNMRDSLAVGDEVTTIGGINGIVRQIKEDEDLFIIESSADKSKIAVKRWALQSKDAAGAESLAAESAAAEAKLNGEKKK